MPSRRLRPDEIEHYRAFLLELARRFETRADRADDLVQDAFVAALERPPRADRPSEPWFAVVVRRLHAASRRAEIRRRAREITAAGALDAVTPDCTEPPRSERLARALAALREPYRSTLLLRYFDDLAPGEIAERTGTPVRTVHTRLARGLALLRQRLRDERAGGFFARWRTRLGGRAALVAAAAVVVATATVWMSGAGSGVASRPRLAVAGAGPAATDRSVAVRDFAAIDRPRDPPPMPPAHAGPTRLVRGRVVDAEGGAVAGATVRFEPGAPSALPGGAVRFVAGADVALPSAVSAADGAFALAVPADRTGRVRADGESLTSIVAALSPPLGDFALLLGVAPARKIDGVVADAAGRAVAGAIVRLRLPAAALARPARLDGTWMAVEPETRTDAGGRFAFDAAAGVDGLVATVDCAGRGHARRAVESGAGPLRIELEAPDAATRVIAGIVVAQDGVPLGDAAVAAADRWTRSEGDGTFALEVPAATAADRVVAVARGRLPAEAAIAAGASTGLRLVVGAESRAIRGRVVDADGRPLAHALVYLGDPTPLAWDAAFWFVEGMAAGADCGALVSAETDADGAFELKGLLDREYALRAMHPLVPFVLKAPPARAGADVELRFPAEVKLPVVRGRVVDRSGQPIAGASLRPRVVALDVPFSGGRRAVVHFAGAVVATDAAGAFALDALPRGVRDVEVSGESLLTREVAPPSDGSDLVVTMDRLVEFRVQLDPAVVRGDSFRLLDAGGKALRLEQLGATTPFGHGRRTLAGELEKGASASYRVAETAVSLVVLDRGRESMRLPITLDAARVNVLGAPPVAGFH